MASIQAASFYAQLQRPAWAPPGWLFGPVWTVLYGMMAVSAWSVWPPWGMGWRACGADSFLGAAGAQWAVELVVLCMASGGVGVYGHRGAVAGAGGDHRCVCEEASSGGVVVGAISGMGELCGGAQFLGLATQPSGAWLICAADLGSHRFGVAIATICCLMRSGLLLEAT
ncbi:tryptophan-rich sensory protein [Xanthomonas citri pv. malvacearum str. GSPB2388]|nr:tryptophan-rich sensory protein [Xanthomonas citri pv. malvacearum str. GSPB2388]